MAYGMNEIENKTTHFETPHYCVITTADEPKRFKIYYTSAGRFVQSFFHLEDATAQAQKFEDFLPENQVAICNRQMRERISQ